MGDESFKYRLVHERGGELADLFHHGMSFKLMIEWGLMPPLRVFNDFLATGIDDTDDEQTTLEWEPTRLGEQQYDDLIEGLRARGFNVRIDHDTESAVSGYGDWFEMHIDAHRRG